eukprot:931926-Amphidinium_carterae.2
MSTAFRHHGTSAGNQGCGCSPKGQLESRSKEHTTSNVLVTAIHRTLGGGAGAMHKPATAPGVAGAPAKAKSQESRLCREHKALSYYSPSCSSNVQHVRN